MAYTNNLTEETKALLRGNQNPIVSGAKQYITQATPRLSNVVNMSKNTGYQPLYIQNTQSSSNNASGGISDLVNGGLSLMNGLGGLGGNKTSESFVPEDNENGNSTLSDLGDIGGSVASLAKTWGNSGSSAGGAMGGYGGIISGGINGLNSFAESGDYKDGLQGFFGVDKDNDSDVMQVIKGTVNGAATGGSVGGPWGAAIGGILGLGSSFLDDI